MTKMLTISGKVVDLVNPTPEMIDVNDIAFHLSHINRFNGAARSANGNMVSVAYHCNVGAIQAELEGDKELALHILLHDAHEAYIGDLTKPTVGAIFATMDEPIDFEGSLEWIKDKLDKAIYAAIGVTMPTNPMRKRIKEMDNRLLRFERDNFLPESDPALWAQEVNEAKMVDWYYCDDPDEPPYVAAMWATILKRLTAAIA